MADLCGTDAGSTAGRQICSVCLQGCFERQRQGSYEGHIYTTVEMRKLHQGAINPEQISARAHISQLDAGPRLVSLHRLAGAMAIDAQPDLIME